MAHSIHTILLIEDNSDDAILLTEALSNIDSSVVVIYKKNGLEAWHYLKQLQSEKQPLPCLIILDLNISVFGTKKLVPVLNNDHAFRLIPVVVFSTFFNQMEQDFFNHYNVAMLIKPSDIEEFSLTLKTILDRCYQNMNL